MIVDTHHYNTEFKGMDIPPEQLERLLRDATTNIHTLSLNRTHHPEYLSKFQLDLVKQAICHQAEHLYIRNDPSLMDIKSISSDGSSIVYNSSIKYSQFAIDLIDQAGLRYLGFEY